MMMELRQLCELLADSDKHKAWLESLGYTVFGGCAWKDGDRENSAFVAKVVKREAEAIIADAIWESDQRAAAADDRIQELEAAVTRWKEQAFRPLGDNHHNAALCPHCGEPLRKATDEIDRLLAAIKEHHDQKADDRCIDDDAKLYAAAGLEPHDCHIGDPEAMLANCKLFIERRCLPGQWPSYADLEHQLARSRATLASVATKLEEAVCTDGCDKGVILLSDRGTTHLEDDHQVYDHEHFSPLGDALVAAWTLAKAASP